MATVAAIFDDERALEQAVNALESAGLGDDIVQIEEGREADSAPETSETPGDDVTLPPIAATGGFLGGGNATAQGAAPLLGTAFAADSGVGARLDDMGDAAEPFRLAAEQGGKLLFLETRKVAEAVAALEGAGAQQIYDPR